MVDFVRLLKKTIDAQKCVTPEIRQYIYKRTRETIQKKLEESNLEKNLISFQINMIEKAINDVEKLYLDLEFQEISLSKSKIENNTGSILDIVNKKEKHLSEMQCFTENESNNLIKKLPPNLNETFSSKEQSSVEDNISNQTNKLLLNNDNKVPFPVLYPDISSSKNYKNLNSDDFSGKNKEKESFFKKIKNFFLNCFFSREKNKKKYNDIGKFTKNHFKEDHQENSLSYNDDIHGDQNLKNKKSICNYKKKFERNSYSNQESKNNLRKKRILRISIMTVVTTCIMFLSIWNIIILFFQKKTPFYHTSNVLVKNKNSLDTKNIVKKQNQRLISEKKEPSLSENFSIKNKKEDIVSKLETKNTKVILYESSSGVFTNKNKKGFVHWSFISEKSNSGKIESVVLGNLLLPKKEISLRIKIRKNKDFSIPVKYLIELIFIVPENFENGPVDNLSSFLLKASEKSTGQELRGALSYKINDNLFVIAIDSSKSFLDYNLHIMQQLPWIQINFFYKNGRMAKLIFEKGEKGDLIFKEAFDSES